MDPLTDDDREPFDEQAFLQQLDYVDRLADGGIALQPDPARLIAHRARKAIAELIRLRNAERLARERCLLLEQGQTLLPLSGDTATNHQPQHLCHEDQDQNR